jgi:subtilase family serine protease
MTPAPQNPPDLVIISVRLDPPTPQANITFTVYATVRNAGGTASPQADAMLTFQPGDERSPADPRIPALLAGQSAEVLFRVTLKGSGTGLTGTIDVDVYNAVNEGGAGEANNRATVTYNVNP